MPTLVHLAPEKLSRRILRAGLRGRPALIETEDGERALAEAVYAMAVLPAFQQTYQWVRELRRWGRGRLVAVTFRVGRDEPLYVGRFQRKKTFGPAGTVLRVVREQPWGAEVMVPRRVAPSEISKVSAIRQDVGWVETPETEHKYACLCPACLPAGTAKLTRRCRAVFNSGLERIHSSDGDGQLIISELCRMELALERAGKRLSARRLLSLRTHASVQVRRDVARTLGHFSFDDVREALMELLDDDSRDVAQAAMMSLVSAGGARNAREQIAREAPHRLDELCAALGEWWTEANESVLRELAEHADERVAWSAQQVLAARCIVRSEHR